MASRGSSIVLEPFSSASLNRYHGLSSARPPLKKRKTHHTVTGELSQQTIRIRPQAAALSDEPYILEPIAVVPRSRLPFSWFGPPSASAQIQTGSLFVAHIPLLEDGLPDRTEPCVLAVRLLSGGELYIVERVKRGIYALSQLARGVEEGDVFVAVKGWNPSECGREAQCEPPVEAADGKEWWELARIDDCTDEAPPPKRVKLDVSLVFDKAPVDAVGKGRKVSPMEWSSSSDSHMPFVLNGSQDSDGAVFGDVPATENTQAAGPSMSPQELLDALREQYLQALYVSKTSVAYFAKGPLARCRAAFRPSESVTSTQELAGFYREAILAAKKMDLKYRETLPTTIRDALLSISDDDSQRPKKRKSRKKKLGKNGLYPEEEGFIRKWWRDRVLTDNGFAAESSREKELKKHVVDLRLRETQLQILLVLETMALEATITDEPKTKDPADPPSGETKPRSKKKPLDLDLLLELHFDRLCIWHIVSTDDTAMADSARSFDSLTGKKVESDAVRDFCTEIIIPFYASRLPDQCKMATRKFGITGMSPFTTQSSTKKTLRREPGKPVDRQPSQRHPRRSLQRVLTDQQTGSLKHPSLGRSNTVPSQSEAIRRSMEPLLPAPSASVRGGIQKAKRAENREVDLKAVTRQHEAKLKKMQMMKEQKRELDAAINALRKPNRELVAKDIAEDADKRASGNGSRKPRNPVRNPLGQGVQVMATPRGNRKREPPPRGIVRSSAGNGSSPFDDPQVIPASIIRPSFVSGSGVDPLDTNQAVVQETPTRRPAQCLLRTAETSGVVKNLFRVPRRPDPSPPVSRSMASQPVGIKSSVVMETPPKPTSVPVTASTASPTAILTTPVKKKARVDVPVPVTPEKSIYAQLGWDDDDELA